MDLKDELLGIEKTLGTGSGDDYRRHLADEAVVVVPGMVMTKDECAAAMDESPGWDEHEITDVRVVQPTEDTALLNYSWRSRRGETTYEAAMSSAYVKRDGDWLLFLHQQTPAPG